MSTDSYSEEENVYFILQLSGQSLREVKAVTQNRNMEAGTAAETTEEHCAAYWVAQLVFLYNSGPPAQEWYHIQWSVLSYVNH